MPSTASDTTRLGGAGAPAVAVAVARGGPVGRVLRVAVDAEALGEGGVCEAVAVEEMGPFEEGQLDGAVWVGGGSVAEEFEGGCEGGDDVGVLTAGAPWRSQRADRAAETLEGCLAAPEMRAQLLPS